MGWLASPTLPRRLYVQGTWMHCFRLKSAGKASLHTWNLVSRGERLHEEPTFPPHASQETVGLPRCSDASPLREDVWPAPAPENATLQVQSLCPSPGLISRCPSRGTVQGTQAPPRPLLHKFLVTSRLSQPINQPSNQGFITLHPGFWELCSHPKILKWDYPDGHRIPGFCHHKGLLPTIFMRRCFHGSSSYFSPTIPMACILSSSPTKTFPQWVHVYLHVVGRLCVW